MTEESKALVDRFLQFLNTGDVSILDELVTEDYIQHNPMVEQGREGVKKFFGVFAEAFTDPQASVENVVAEGDRIAGQFTVEVTHTGDFMGIPATGKRVAMKSIDIWRVENGQFAEHWDVVDMFGFMQQLGVGPGA